MANWDVENLTPLQLRMLRETIQAKKRNVQRLGALELAGLLQDDGSFINTRRMTAEDAMRSRQSQTSLPLEEGKGVWGQHAIGNRNIPPAISMNMATPGTFGTTYPHELLHNALRRYKVDPSEHHPLIDAYQSSRFKRGTAPFRQTGPDVSRRGGPSHEVWPNLPAPVGRYDNPMYNRKNNPIVPKRSEQPDDKVQQVEALDVEAEYDTEHKPGGQAEKRRRWWANNQHRLMRKLYGQILR